MKTKAKCLSLLLLLSCLTVSAAELYEQPVADLPPGHSGEIVVDYAGQVQPVDIEVGQFQAMDIEGEAALSAPLSTPYNRLTNFCTNFCTKMGSKFRDLSPKRIAYATVGTLVAAGVVVAIIGGTKGFGGSGETPVLELGRGMYISIHSTQIGTWSLSEEYQNILGNSTKENRVLDFIKKYEVKTISLYDLWRILPSADLSDDLSKFMARAKEAGVKEIFAIAASYKELDNALKHQVKYREKFDGIISELEFWNQDLNTRQADYLNFIDLLKAMRTGAKNADSPGLIISAYIGGIDVPNITPAQVAEDLSKNLDRVYLSCYGTSPLSSYNVCKSRFEYFGNVANPIPVISILSSEGVNFRAAEKPFLGDWLAGNTIEIAEKAFRAEVENSPSTNKPNILNKFYYYEYAFLCQYLPH